MSEPERTLEYQANKRLTGAYNNVLTVRLAMDMDMDIHGYIHVWISDLGYTMDISTPFDMNCHIINFEYSSACHTIQP